MPSAHRTFSPEERRRAVETFEKSGLTQEAFARTWGVTPWTLSKWRRRYRDGGPKALEGKRLGRPKGSGTLPSLAAPIRAAIVETKRRFSHFGLRRVRDFLRRFEALSVSVGSVRKVVRAEGLPPALEPRRPKPKRVRVVRRFERARPRELWQSDLTVLPLARHRERAYLVVFLDDHSRYVVSWGLHLHQKSDIVIEALREGIARFGKPREVLTDQGRQYYAWRGRTEFQRLLAREGIRHVVARAHHPETVGKCERLWETVKTELWDRVVPQDLGEARERLTHFFSHYNHFRTHQGIDGMVPADRFFGAEDAVRKAIETALAENELQLALGEPPRKPVFLVGRIGDRDVSLHGERGRLVIQRPEGGREEIGMESLGVPSGKGDDDDHGRGEHERSSDGLEHSADGDAGAGVDRSGSDAGSAGFSRPHAPGEEARPLPAPSLPGGAGAGAVEGGIGGGAEESARDLRGDRGDVAREDLEAGGGKEAPSAASTGLAAQSAGGLGDGGGAPHAAEDPGRGDDRARRAGRGTSEEGVLSRGGALEGEDGDRGVESAPFRAADGEDGGPEEGRGGGERQDRGRAAAGERGCGDRDDAIAPRCAKGSGRDSEAARCHGEVEP